MIVVARTVSVGLGEINVLPRLCGPTQIARTLAVIQPPHPTLHSSREFEAPVPSKPTINTEFADRLEQSCGPCNNPASSVLWRSDASIWERVRA